MEKAQFIMVWFLPLTTIGGFFYPMLGYLVLGAILGIATKHTGHGA